jgi:hypothetical protein
MPAALPSGRLVGLAGASFRKGILVEADNPTRAKEGDRREANLEYGAPVFVARTAAIITASDRGDCNKCEATEAAGAEGLSKGCEQGRNHEPAATLVQVLQEWRYSVALVTPQASLDCVLSRRLLRVCRPASEPVESCMSLRFAEMALRVFAQLVDEKSDAALSERARPIGFEAFA